ncbi:MAG: hypothetical protein R3F37_08460 [Candidatus Competibacteraceae bacterium]
MGAANFLENRTGATGDNPPDDNASLVPVLIGGLKDKSLVWTMKRFWTVGTPRIRINATGQFWRRFGLSWHAVIQPLHQVRIKRENCEIDPIAGCLII